MSAVAESPDHFKALHEQISSHSPAGFFSPGSYFLDDITTITFNERKKIYGFHKKMFCLTDFQPWLVAQESISQTCEIYEEQTCVILKEQSRHGFLDFIM